MPDLDLSALRKVAEAAKLGSHGQWMRDGEATVMLPDKPGNSWDGRRVAYAPDPIESQHIATFDPPTVLALLDELENLRITAKEDRQYVEETDDRMKRHLAKAWWEGVTAQWTHLPPGNRVPQSENPYRQVSDG